MKIVLCFDSFKGSCTAREACQAAAEGIRTIRPDAEILLRPMADGGEGTADILRTALGGDWIPRTVAGPLPGMTVSSVFAWIAKTQIAVVEMASASGLTLIPPEKRNPLIATTYGTGELIRAAAEKGAKRILLTVGGSATVDGGVGAAEALGWTFPPDGSIRPPKDLALPPIDVLCDVTNPLCGPSGAARVYGPQKGATPAMVEELESRLWNLSERIFQSLEKEVRDLPGAGAAGGLAAGAVAFMNATIVRGIDAVMSAAGLAEALHGADWALTGEGSFDAQSLQGKVVDGVARLAAQAGAKTAVLAGRLGLTESEWRTAGITYAAAIRPETISVEDSMRHASELLAKAARMFARGAGSK